MKFIKRYFVSYSDLKDLYFFKLKIILLKSFYKKLFVKYNFSLVLSVCGSFVFGSANFQLTIFAFEKL